MGAVEEVDEGSLKWSQAQGCMAGSLGGGPGVGTWWGPCGWKALLLGSFFSVDKSRAAS